MMYNLREELAVAKGLGSAKTGTSHWLYQRITAVVLLICSVWMIYFIKSSLGKDIDYFVKAIHEPYNLVPASILVITSFYHAILLGMRVVLEDYISCVKLRTILIILLQLFCIVTVVSFVMALISIVK